MHAMVLAWDFARPSPGNSRAARIAMIPMTTRSSIRVNADGGFPGWNRDAAGTAAEIGSRLADDGTAVFTHSSSTHILSPYRGAIPKLVVRQTKIQRLIFQRPTIRISSTGIELASRFASIALSFHCINPITRKNFIPLLITFVTLVNVVWPPTFCQGRLKSEVCWSWYCLKPGDHSITT